MLKKFYNRCLQVSAENLLIIVFLLCASILVLFNTTPKFVYELDKGRIIQLADRPNSANSELTTKVYAYPIENRVNFPWVILRDSSEKNTDSGTVFYQNNQYLDHDINNLYTLGGQVSGRYAYSKFDSILKQNQWSHAIGVLTFTSLNNSDPRIDKNKYTVEINSVINPYLLGVILFFISICVVLLLLPYLKTAAKLVFSAVKFFLIAVGKFLLSTGKFVLDLYYSPIDRHKKQLNYFLGFVFLLVFINTVYMIFNFQYLRPFYDDLIHAELVLRLGFIDSIAWWWNSWNGFIPRDIITQTLVGLPVAYFPLSLASFVPALFFIVTIGLGGLYIFRNGIKLKLFEYVIGAMYLITVWWLFLWSRNSIFNDFGVNNQFAYAIVSWLDINSIYIVPAVFILIFAIKFNLKGSLTFRSALYTALFGLFCGSIYYVFNASLLAMLVLSPLFFWGFKEKISHRNLILGGIFAASLLIASYIAIKLAPGTAIRQAIIIKTSNPQFNFGSLSELSAATIWDMVNFTVPFSLKFIASNIISWGALMTLSSAAGFSYLYSQKFNQENIRFYLNLSIVLGVYFLINILITRFVEGFSYDGFWHYTTSVLILFYSLTSIGLWLGIKIKQKNSKLSMIFLVSLFVNVTIAFTIGSKVFADLQIRKDNWERGLDSIYHTQQVFDFDRQSLLAVQLQVTNCLREGRKDCPNPDRDYPKITESK
ncbi:MAG: hypothetical protein QM523_05760 [Candidatus Pacebacteria bacterium]|nr:hypothetical protein [Candidatus Paceibacterota bacterium]